MKRIDRDTAVGLAVVVAAAAALRLRPFYDLDWWWHVSAGRAVLATGARVVPEPTAFQGPATYVDPEWAFDVLAVALQAVGGTTAAIVFTAVCAAASALFVFLTAREAGDDETGAVLITALVAAASSWHFQARPQSLQMVLTPLALWLALRVRRHAGRPRRRALLGLHVALAVWAQVHTSVVVAPLVVWLACLPGLPASPPFDRRTTIALAALAVWPLTGAFGLGIVDQVLRHADAADATRYILDMQPGSLGALLSLQSPSSIPLVFLLLLGIVAAVRRRRLVPGPVLLVLLGLAMMLTANRFVAVWAVLAVPFVASARSGGRASPSVLGAAAAILPIMLLLDRGGLGLAVDVRYVPTALGDAIEARHVEGRLFAEYADAGYLGWRFAPELRVFLDGRTPVHFDADDLYASRRGIRDLGVLDRLDVIYDLDAVAIRRDRPVCGPLAAEGRFAPVWADDLRVLFVKGAPTSIADPCLPPVDPTPAVGPRGADLTDAWEDALSQGGAHEVRAQAEAVVDTYGHEVAPIVRLRLAEACAALRDDDCVAKQAWRAALEGEPGAMLFVRGVVDRLAPGPRRAHLEALIAGARKRPELFTVAGGARAVP